MLACGARVCLLGGLALGLLHAWLDCADFSSIQTQLVRLLHVTVAGSKSSSRPIPQTARAAVVQFNRQHAGDVSVQNSVHRCSGLPTVGQLRTCMQCMCCPLRRRLLTLRD